MPPEAGSPQPEAGGATGRPALQPEVGGGGGQEQGQAAGPAEKPPARRHPPAPGRGCGGCCHPRGGWRQHQGTRGTILGTSLGNMGVPGGGISRGCRAQLWGHLGEGGRHLQGTLGTIVGTSAGDGGVPGGQGHLQGTLGTPMETAAGSVSGSQGGISRIWGYLRVASAGDNCRDILGGCTRGWHLQGTQGAPMGTSLGHMGVCGGPSPGDAGDNCRDISGGCTRGGTHLRGRRGKWWGHLQGTWGYLGVASPGDTTGTHGDISGGHGGMRGGGGGHLQGTQGTNAGTSLGEGCTRGGCISRGHRGHPWGHLQELSVEARVASEGYGGTRGRHLWGHWALGGGTLGDTRGISVGHHRGPRGGTPGRRVGNGGQTLPRHPPPATHLPSAPASCVPHGRLCLCPSVPLGWGQGPWAVGGVSRPWGHVAVPLSGTQCREGSGCCRHPGADTAKACPRRGGNVGRGGASDTAGIPPCPPPNPCVPSSTLGTAGAITMGRISPE